MAIRTHARRALRASLVLVAILAAVPDARAAREEPENLPDPRTRRYPVIEWARNYAGGKPRVLFISRPGDAWDIYELALRMDIDFDVFHSGTVDGKFTPATDYYHEGIKLYPELKRDLGELLKQKWDAIVFAAYNPLRLPADLHYRLVEAVAGGTGVVLFSADRWNMSFNYPSARPTNDVSFLAAIPLSALTLPKVLPATAPPRVAQNGAFLPETLETAPVPWEAKPVAVRSLGKGKIYAFASGGGSYFGGPSMHPSAPQDPGELTQAEYFFSLAAKLVLAAAGKGPGVRILGLDAEGRTFAPGAAAAMAVTLDGPFKGTARTVVRTRRNEVVYTREEAGLAAAGDLSLPLPALPAGSYYVDVWLLRGKQVAEWGSAAFVVRADGAAITALDLPGRSFARADTLSATVKTEGAPAGATVAARIRDASGRILVAAGGIAVADGQAAVKLPLGRTREIYHTLETDLVADGLALDTRHTFFTVPRQPERDLVVFTDGDARNLNGKRRLDIFREYGVTLVETPGRSLEAVAGGFDLSYRIWLTHCHPMNGGCLASPGYHRDLEEHFRAIAELYKPYGLAFFNTGDDSGVGDDFCGSKPDWVRPLIQSFARRHGKEIGPFCKSRGLSHFGEFWRMGWSITMEQLAAMKLQPGDFELFQAAWRETYPTIAAFNRAHGTAFAGFDAIRPGDIASFKPVSPCILAFRDRMKEKYGTAEALNAAWGSDLASFEAIARETPDALSAERKYGAFLDKRTFLEDLFVEHMATAARGIRRVLPDTGIGQGAASYGNIIPEVLGALDSAMPYLEYRDIELIRSVPHRYCGRTIGVYGGKKVAAAAREHQVWSTLFAGGNFIWFWSMCTGGLEGDLGINPGRSGVMLENIREAQGGIARALIGAERLHDGIAILHPRASGTLSMLVKDLGTTFSSESGFQNLIEDLGLQYRYTWTAEVEAGSLRKGEFKALILPYAQILTDREVSEIRAFVADGGLLIADLRPGTHDVHGRPLANGALDDLFGVRTACAAAVPVRGTLAWTHDLAGAGLGRPVTAAGMRGDGAVRLAGGRACAAVGGAPALIVHASGKGRTIFLNHAVTGYDNLRNRGGDAPLRSAWRDLLAACGISARFAAVRSDGTAIPGVEMAVFRDGPVDYLTVEKHAYECETYPIGGVIRLDRAAEVYDVRKGRRLGRTGAIPVSLSGLSCSVYSLLPYEVTGLRVTGPKTVPRGGEAGIAATVTARGGVPGPHVIRFDVFRPSGERLWPMIKTRLREGRAAATLPVAFNEEKGTWTVTVTDVTTGLSREQKFTVR